MTAKGQAVRGADGESYIIPGRQPVREALLAGRELRLIAVDRRLSDSLAEILTQADTSGVPVRVTTRDELDALAGEVRHQGVVAVAPPFAYASLDTLAVGSSLLVVLDGITDPRNLGAIARVAEQAGAGGLIIRTRRAASPSPAAEKAAAGALSWIPVAAVPNISRAVMALREHGFWSLGLTGEAATPLWDHPLMDDRVALVVGEEGEGLSRLVSETVDARICIPMAGRLDSLNASTAVAVSAFEWARRRKQALDS